jgi:hypothetical protein
MRAALNTNGDLAIQQVHFLTRGVFPEKLDSAIALRFGTEDQKLVLVASLSCTRARARREAAAPRSAVDEPRPHATTPRGRERIALCRLCRLRAPSRAPTRTRGAWRERRHWRARWSAARVERRVERLPFASAQIDLLCPDSYAAAFTFTLSAALTHRWKSRSRRERSVPFQSMIMIAPRALHIPCWHA